MSDLIKQKGINVSIRTPFQAAKGRLGRRFAVAAAVAAVGGGLAAAPASAEFGLRPDPGNPAVVDFQADAFDQNGDPYTQAGGYPFRATTSFTFNSVRDIDDNEIPDGNAKDILIDLPAGLVGNPQAVATCETEQFMQTMPNGLNACPIDSQVGMVRLDLFNGGNYVYYTPIYNMRPASDEIAAFMFSAVTVPVRAVPTVRSNGDYGLLISTTNINETVGIRRVEFSLWGVPADPAHDRDRAYLQIDYNGAPFQRFGGNVSASSTPKPFFINPATCDHGPYTTSLRTRSWQNPAEWKSYSVLTKSGVTGCGNLKWEPSINVQPDNTQAGAPTGLRVDIDVPQHDNPAVPATPPLKKAVVRLPEGVRVSPSASDGLGACTDAQVALNSTGRASCPDSSNIGTVAIDTPLLAEPLVGNIFLGTQRPDQLLRLFIVAEGRGNLIIKLPGKVDPDPVTGQLLATFDDNPQLPFSRLSLYFKGGPRASLTNPSTCGVKTTTTGLSAWSGQVAQPSSSFTIDRGPNGGPCAPLGFAPGFSAGTTNATGGADSNFTLTFSRSDADQELKDLTVRLPKGLLARIANVDLCADALAAAGTCGDGSRIGSVTTAAGPGTSPFHLPGRVYMTGPYKGAPYGMSIVVPAVAGPFDLGTVVVRTAVHVDRSTTELSIVSDPLPSILMGIPLQIRSVNVSVDKPSFMFNPTNCTAAKVAGTIGSIAGALANVSSRFQVGDCATLPFKPKMALKVGAKGKLTRGKRTPLTVTLSMTRGQANNRSVQVTLPKALNARLDVVNRRVACSIEQFRADRCPMVVGSASAVTPLLRDPLRGPAYFVYNPDRRLPDLVVRLKGQVNVDLVGKVTITRDLKLQTTFDTVPDVPITTFRLALESGSRNGPIGVTRNLCAATTRKALAADLAFVAQNNRKVTVGQKISVAGCGRASSRSKRASRSNRRSSAKKKSKR
ncbi:hypothetical protein VSS74_04145 [Conexibacter stalactiti]|uniref:Uncharacterized protein n=1 Tax=Conexibacter stalactiti TaxID=1940611 RepID=A0ABU4HJM7_9ACTN|nr:hypothetical protein [Conexibacter stalactiti]MDW5593514.1 hypothetical protein [Conexibacter stalactiti]MEC5034155.1 hypothetical protein [Conexibacter stalactiti]